MNKLPLLALTGCLTKEYDIPSEDISKCKPEIVALEQACDAWDGGFDKAVVEARKCFGEDVKRKIVCSNPGPYEPHHLKIY